MILAALVASAWLLLFLAVDHEGLGSPRRLGYDLERRLRRARATMSAAFSRRSAWALIALHFAVVLGVGAGLWWFILPDAPDEALYATLKAAGAGIYAELWAMRLRA
ncbi:hypothetical protein [Salinarimonas soli]|uniref:Uncharacterized protein n=1 Tax=Salinarimonas soli TaxID=1638099 RepID=A0A5B2VDB8_9HYPH|nr:hypothetical protein [Salinarimonas soli]KAA2236944.1 hypothetical protein F0L46_11770 [Salinarimonas soli]